MQHQTAPRTCCLTAVALACALGVTAASANTLLKTDAAWSVTPSAPAALWNAAIGFDDAAWQAATVLYNVADFPGYGGYTAQGIWSSGGQYSRIETTIWARQVFQLAALPASASLLAGFDDDADVWVNGTLVISDHNGIANGVGVANLLPYLSVGNNLVAFTVTDNYPGYGYNHSAWLQIDGQMAAVTAVPKSTTTALMLAGLAATAFSVRRRKVRPKAT